MGNEASLTKDCKLEKEIPTATPKAWRLYQSRRRDGSKVSVFVYDPEQHNLQYIENAAKYMKVLRHPSVLKFDGIENTYDGIWLATEQVIPLENVLEDLTSAEIVAGIYNLLDGLVFLHERGGLSHNNICLSSVFVSEDGSWKLGGIEYLCRFDQATAAYLGKCKKYRDEKSLAPEEKAGKLDSSSPGWSRDTFAFGVLTEALLEYITDLGDLTKTFDIRIQDECLDPNPDKRPKLKTFLQDRLFKNDFLEIVNFLKNITLKTPEEKRDFFCDATEMLYKLPIDIVANRLVHPLLSRFVLLDPTACESLLPHLLSTYTGEKRPEFSRAATNPILPEKLFRNHVIPEIFKIFHVRDVHIRLVLLEHFDSYVDYFDKQLLSHSILPQILLGLRDTNDVLVRMSLHAVACLVPILGGDLVVGAHRSKVFVEATPKFGGAHREVHVTSSKQSWGMWGDQHEANGLITQNVSSDEKKTLQDIARDAENEKRREEAKHRSEERRKRRQEKVPIKAKVIEDCEPQNIENDHHSVRQSQSHSQSENTRHQSDWSADHEPSTNRETEPNTTLDGSGLTESDIDQEIEDELEVMETTLPPSKQEKIKYGSPLQSKQSAETDSNNSKTNSAGALKLKMSKMRTSPPPARKTGATQSENKPATGNDSWGADDTETWAEGGEDDKWNSTDWDDMETNNSNKSETNKSSTTKHSPTKSVTSPERKHSRASSTGSVHSPDGSPSPVADSRSLSNKRNSQDSNKKTNAQLISKHTKPKVVDLDIMALDIKTSGKTKKSEEADLDFFADMQPEIKPDKDSLWGMLNTKSTGKQMDKSNSKVVGNQSMTTVISDGKDVKINKSLSFAIREEGQTADTEGWGDEDNIDWGAEDV